MKSLKSVLFVLAAILMASCTGKGEEETRAKSALQTVQSRYENYIDDTNDSLINIALDYYETHGNSRDKMLTYFHKGCIEYNKGNYSVSIVNLHKAEREAKQLDDRYYLGMTYRYISRIYTSIYNGAEQLHYAQLAVETLKSTDGNLPDAMLDLGKAYNNNLEFEKSLHLAQQLVDTASIYHDDTLMEEALSLAANSLVGMGNDAEALNYYRRVMQMDSAFVDSRDVQNISLAYSNVNKKDSSDYILSYYSGCNGDETPYEILFLNGKYKEAYTSLEQQCRKQDDVIKELLSQNVTKSVSDYNQYEQILKDKVISRDRLIRLLIIVIGVAIIIALVLVIRSLKLSQKRREEEMILQAQNMSEELRAMNLRTQRASSSVGELFGKRFESIDKLCGTYYECLGTTRNQKKIYEEVKSIIDGLGNDTSMIAELEEYANKYMNNLMADFRSAMPELKEADCQLFLYCLLGFSSRSISLFLDEKIEVVYNRKSRLKNKIKQSVSERKEEFLTHM
jgi:type II secretory pathway pseudopilin PulG